MTESSCQFPVSQKTENWELVSKMVLRVGFPGPQGLKPAFLLARNGTAEAVPYPKPIYEIASEKWQLATGN